MDRSGSVVTTSTTVSAAVFLTSAIATVYLCRSMSGEMPMPGGWSMSMAWMRMPGQTWPGALLMFAGMWTAMMIAMMLPALAPRQPRLPFVSAYLLVWAATGIVVYPIGVALAIAEMRHAAIARAVPLAAGIVIVLAGCVQLSPWKMRALACCRGASPTTWGAGIRLGAECILCCSGYMAAFLIAGVMNLAAMALTTVIIAVERAAPRPDLVARAAGVALVALGAGLIIRAV